MLKFTNDAENSNFSSAKTEKQFEKCIHLPGFDEGQAIEAYFSDFFVNKKEIKSGEEYIHNR